MNVVRLGVTADEELIRAVADGSPAALAELYRRHADLVYRTAYRFLGNDADAADVVQDVFVALPEALVRFELGRPLEPWLRRVAVRAALSHLRSESRRTRRESASPPGPSAAAAPALEALLLRRALGRLPAGLRAVLLLKEVEGYTHAEIGELLGISAGASATRLSRAWTLLRRELRGYE